MAYYDQDKKKQVAPAIKALLKKYGLKGSLSVKHYSTVVLTIKEGSFDVVKNYIENYIKRHNELPQYINESTTSHEINTYWYKEQYTGKILKFLKEAYDILNKGNYDLSGSMTDYDIGWYVEIKFGTWNKPYKLVQD